MDNKENQRIVQKVAKKHGKSAEDTKAELESAIMSAYVFPNEKALSIPKKGEVPTIDEFFDFIIKDFEKELTKNNF